jgi:hypothetical protein
MSFSGFTKCFAFYFHSSYIDESIDDDLTFSSTDDKSNDQEPNRSIRRDYAPVFFIMGLVFALILLVLVNILYKQHQIRERNNRSHRERQNNDTIYSPISSANEFELN